MHYKTNRLNHDFQIEHFIAGSCHTADGAFAILCDLREDRAAALASLEAVKLRERAKRIRAERLLKSEDEAERLEGAADLAEIEASRQQTQTNEAAAREELAFIVRCIEAVQPLRQFKHLSDSEAHEAAQREEWRLELIHRAENSLLTTGSISTDHFATMRLHPDFESSILPAIHEMRLLLAQPDGPSLIVSRISKSRFCLPDLARLASSKRHDESAGD